MQQASFQPGTAPAAMAASTVELSIEARNLIDMDLLSKSDPVCVLFAKQYDSAPWREICRTEKIDNNLNPQFARKFDLDYFFEERQLLKFEIYDIDTNSARLEEHDFLGYMECSLGEIVAAGKLTRSLKGPREYCGEILIRAEELDGCKQEVQLSFAAKGLEAKGRMFSSAKSMLVLYKVNEDGSYTVVHRSEAIKGGSPTWKKFGTKLRSLCGGDYQRSILVRCVDFHQSSGEEKLIGEVTTNMAELKSAAEMGSSLQLINPWKRGKSAGSVWVTLCDVTDVNSFLDYVHAGTELSCVIAIDFTASNGDPRRRESLHFWNPHEPNQYSMALEAVGTIIQDYDSDKLFPVFGFGARLPPDGKVSHDFAVNGSADNPNCEGIPGVLAAYGACIRNVQLYGPTNFAPIIRMVSGMASQKRDGSEYTILLLITDGVITDLPQARDAIVAASNLPLSIIIVGVGNDTFEAMTMIDGDEDGPYGRLRNSRGEFAKRDIVQFVSFRDFVRPASHTVGQLEAAQVLEARLAKEVLAEIPDQFLSYMKTNGIRPGSWQGRAPSVSANAFQSGSNYKTKPAVGMPEPPPAYGSWSGM